VEKIFSFQVVFWLWRRHDWLIEVRKEVPGLGVTGPEDVVPIVLGGAEAAKRGVESDHLFSDGVAGGVGIKTAIDGKALG